MMEGSVSGSYQGERFMVSPDGELMETMTITTNEYTFKEKDGFRGREKRYGNLLEIEAVASPGLTVSLIEVTDHVSGSIAGLTKWVRDEKLSHVHGYVLRKSS
jgi:hypothetical protein